MKYLQCQSRFEDILLGVLLQKLFGLHDREITVSPVDSNAEQVLRSSDFDMSIMLREYERRYGRCEVFHGTEGTFMSTLSKLVRKHLEQGISSEALTITTQICHLVIDGKFKEAKQHMSLLNHSSQVAPSTFSLNPRQIPIAF